VTEAVEKVYTVVPACIGHHGVDAGIEQGYEQERGDPGVTESPEVTLIDHRHQKGHGEQADTGPHRIAPVNPEPEPARGCRGPRQESRAKRQWGDKAAVEGGRRSRQRDALPSLPRTSERDDEQHGQRHQYQLTRAEAGHSREPVGYALGRYSAIVEAANRW